HLRQSLPQAVVGAGGGGPPFRGAGAARAGLPQDLLRQREAAPRALAVGPSVSLESIPEEGRRALARLIELAGPERSAWLVGGALRELLTERGIADLDVAVSRGALELGRRLADRLGGGFVELDAARGACRIVAATERGLPLDLVDLRAPTLDGDLRARDFTVNALAVSLGDILRNGRAPISDPTG